MVSPFSITIMLGGFSAEREVSLKTGAAVAKALRSLGHTVHELDPRDESWSLAAGTEVVFLALHGTYGEDGAVQLRLEELAPAARWATPTTRARRSPPRFRPQARQTRAPGAGSCPRP